MTETTGAKTRRGRKPTTKKTEWVVDGIPNLDGMSLVERIACIQQEVNPLGRNTQGFQYNYADYSMVWDQTLKKLFEKYKLVYITTAHPLMPVQTGAQLPILNLDCIVGIRDVDSYKTFSDPSGDESIKFSIAFAVGSDQKEVGKSLTYYRRYALQCIFGLTVMKDGEDVDAFDQRVNNSSKSTTPKPILDPKMMGEEDPEEEVKVETVQEDNNAAQYFDDEQTF